MMHRPLNLNLTLAPAVILSVNSSLDPSSGAWRVVVKCRECFQGVSLGPGDVIPEECPSCGKEWDAQAFIAEILWLWNAVYLARAG